MTGEKSAKNPVESTLNQTLENAVSHMLEGYQIIDRDFRYLYVNPAAARHGQTTVEALLGHRMSEVYPGIEATELYGRLREAMFDGGIHFMMNPFTFPDGTLGYFELRIQPVPEGVVVFSIDVTERERERERNEKLTRRLRQTERLEAIGRITGGVAHDFNNMLTVLLMGLDAIEANAAQNHRIVAELGYLRGEAARAARMAQQLLAFSRQKIAKPRRVDLNHIVRDMTPMLQKLCGGNIVLSTECADGLGEIVIDPGFVEQIILNLVVNARDAMPDGGSLAVRTKQADLDAEYVTSHATCKPGRYATLIVHDTGVGMNREVLEKIFEPFFTTKAAGTGTGLGLATVYGLTQQAGGAVEVYSEPGRGTAFKVYLPVAEKPGENPAPVKPAEHAGKSLAILLVDDEPNLRRLIASLLEREGHQITACNNADTAKAELSGVISFDLLITDMAMPGQSGLELAQRALLEEPRLRAILMSGYAVQNFETPAIAGRILMLEKPFSREQLNEAITSLLPR
jgi:two-component system cell cycle sensor histidine kinase/response regulator CckA